MLHQSSHSSGNANRLSVAMAANDAAYRRAVQTSAPGECWDFLVLTAANEKQADGYRQELALRQRAVGPTGAFFPAIQRGIVVPDPPGKRAGSGGATLGALRDLARQFDLSGEDFDALRILVIHSGGASQRLPAYSPLGKIFSPLPLLRPDGQICTLFDHLYLTLAGLPERLGPGMLIVAGDVFLLFDHRQVSSPPPGVTALTISVPADLGRGHGVFVVDDQSRIRQTLQKAPIELMNSAGATDARGNVLIDTGLLFFDTQTTRKLAHISGCADRSSKSRKTSALQDRFPGQIDLYEDVTAALATGTDRRQYLADARTASMRRVLWNELHGVGFAAMHLEGEFLHLGTTRQFRDAMVIEGHSPAARLFHRNILAGGTWNIGPGRRVYHTALLGDRGQIAAGSVVEHSILGPGTSIGEGCMVSQTLAVQQPLKLPPQLLFFQVPIQSHRGRRLCVQVVCGVSDDFKGRFPAGPCLFLNAPIEDWLKRHAISANDIWKGTPADHRTLWTARLFVGTESRDSAGSILWFTSSSKPAASTLAGWKKSPRFSMADLLALSDPHALIEHRETVAAVLHTGMLIDSIQHDCDRPLDALVPHYSSLAAYESGLRQLDDFSSKSAQAPQSSLRQARAEWSAAQLLQRPDYPGPSSDRPRIDRYMTLAFSKIAEASELGMRAIHVTHGGHLQITPGARIEAASPVRLDLAGGWSDTPPYCYERGGHVVNVAIDLAGQPPVRAMVRAVREPILILESNDLAQHIEITRGEQLKSRPDVRDPFALHKVALDLVGIAPPDRSDLSKRFRKLGGGLIVSTECRVPKGSGLGTSSILAATLLGAIHEAVDQHVAPEQLVRETLLLEQRLSTGGGWQDQVGGIIGGVKSTISPAGVPQQLGIEQLNLPEERLRSLEERLVVYYSGQQRLARDILRRVMGRWLAREPAVVALLIELKTCAAALRTAMLAGKWLAAAREIARYWEIKKQLYPGSTTPAIDLLFLETRRHYLAAGLAGAGGGGFAYFLCKDAAQAGRLRENLAGLSTGPASLGSLYPAAINRHGLKITRS